MRTGCPQNIKDVTSNVMLFVFQHKALLSASAADDITPFIIFAIIDIGPFIV